MIVAESDLRCWAELRSWPFSNAFVSTLGKRGLEVVIPARSNRVKTKYCSLFRPGAASAVDAIDLTREVRRLAALTLR